jgi:hypothetical protein
MRGMNVAPLLPLPTNAAARVLPLVPDEPRTVIARAAILGGCGEVFVDDPAHPTAVAINLLITGRSSFFLSGDADNPVLADAVRALTGPAILRASAAIAARLPGWRPDATPRLYTAFTFPASAADTAFIALPPGGVRRLRPNDARHLAGLPTWLWGIWGTPDAMLHAAPAYARYLRGELVSVACVTAETEQYMEIVAYTIERTRRNGFARECAQRLIGAIVNERGKQPVLTTTADNDAVTGFAQSLGLTARTETTGYAIP